ncbi:type II toxin-antitoxin system VapC family toxin [Roseateles sp. L2-2]|uniref:type II toxin-antitoxin system VapC family toxin n=1 Tax=Roseateles sp. L2-2 TaxID=3422597 RepID=UPI003D368BBE
MTVFEHPASAPPLRPVVVDTSAWIEFLANSDLGRQIKSTLPPFTHCIVPTIVQHELAKWALRTLNINQHDFIERTLEDCPVDMLDTATAKEAAKINAKYKLPSADALIYATAQKFSAEVITCDAHFKDLPLVQFYPKNAKPRGVGIGSDGRWEGWPTSAQMSPLIQ